MGPCWPAQGSDSPGEYLTTGQAANLLGVHGRRIRRWVDTGRLQGVRLGGRTLVHRDSVRAELEALEAIHPEPRERTPESIRAEREWHELLLRSLPADKVEGLESLHEKLEDGCSISPAERAEMAALDREIADAAAQHLKSWVRQSSEAAP